MTGLASPSEVWVVLAMVAGAVLLAAVCGRKEMRR